MTPLLLEQSFRGRYAALLKLRASAASAALVYMFCCRAVTDWIQSPESHMHLKSASVFLVGKGLSVVSPVNPCIGLLASTLRRCLMMYST